MNKDQQFEAIKDLLYASDEASVSLGILQLERAAKECKECKELLNDLMTLWLRLRSQDEYSDEVHGRIWSVHDMLMLDEVFLCLDIGQSWDGSKVALLGGTEYVRLYHGDNNVYRVFANKWNKAIQLSEWLLNVESMNQMRSLKGIRLPDGYNEGVAHNQLRAILPSIDIDALPF